MTKNNGFKVAALAASIALAMGATSAMAADPAAGQLPGQGKVTGAAAVTFDNTAHTMGVALTGNAVINWGAGTGVESATTNVNSTGTAGFNIGKGATVTFSGAFGALNVDNTGNPSQIFGTLAGGDSKVFVANTNGIIVGATGNITATTGSVNLVANTLIDSATDFQANGTLTNFQGAGGDVTVLKGAQSTGTLLISGGGTVNVDIAALDGANTTINAGVKGGTLVGTSDNKSASVTITGDGTLGALGSAGTATTTGTLALNANNVSGVLTNSGTLTLPAANGGVVNNGTLGESAAAGYTSLTNNGTYTAAGNTTVTGGDLVNNGIYDAGTNGITVVGGNFNNNATVNGAGAILVTNGTVTNSGTLAGVTSLDTASDAAAKNFAAAGQYYIVNAGTISSDASGTLTIGTNVTRAGTTNKTTGSFTNTGVLQLDTADALSIAAYNNLTLGGSLQVGTSPTFKAVSLTNPVGGSVTLTAGGYDSGTDSFAAAGALTVATPVVFVGGSFDAAGPQVKFMDNVTGVLSNSDKTPTGYIDVAAGAAVTDDYAVRVAAGKTISANRVYVGGATGDDAHPNVILQGTASGNDVEFGYNGVSGNYQAISDLYSGTAGGIVGTGSNPFVEISFTGAVKVAKYLNDANNFRYNYLPITNAGTGTLYLELDPFAYNTNGTSNGLSAVNVLVDGDVFLYDPWFTGAGAPAPTVVNGTGTGVTGVLNVPNTHLVLQSTGNIEVDSSFYWPGYAYLGTIDSNADGSPAPGTLSADNAITLDGNFSNVLPGDVAGASGIHFMSAKPLVATGAVTTNANAWINFPTDLLTQNYAQGILTSPTFSGGTAAGLVVTYGPLDPSAFNTHPVDSSK